MFEGTKAKQLEDLDNEKGSNFLMELEEKHSAGSEIRKVEL